MPAPLGQRPFATNVDPDHIRTLGCVSGIIDADTDGLDDLASRRLPYEEADRLAIVHRHAGSLGARVRTADRTGPHDRRTGRAGRADLGGQHHESAPRNEDARRSGNVFRNRVRRARITRWCALLLEVVSGTYEETAKSQAHFGSNRLVSDDQEKSAETKRGQADPSESSRESHDLRMLLFGQHSWLSMSPDPSSDPPVRETGYAETREDCARSLHDP